jgi:hypothetical protein
MLSGITQNAANLSDILATPNERSKNHVYILFNSKPEVKLVLLRQRWKINVGLRKIDALLRRKFAVVQGHDL